MLRSTSGVKLGDTDKVPSVIIRRQVAEHQISSPNARLVEKLLSTVQDNRTHNISNVPKSPLGQ